MTTKQYKLNLPEEVDEWIENGAAQSLRSKSAEIIFHLRKMMQNEKSGNPA